MYIAIDSYQDGESFLGFGVTPEDAVLALNKEHAIARRGHVDVLPCIPGEAIHHTDEETPGLMRFSVVDGVCVRVDEQFINDVLEFRQTRPSA